MVLLLFIILLSAIVVVHEFGHLIAAKMFNVYCEEFSIGIGPKVISYKAAETTYSIRLFPIGGFVAMAGDTENDLETKVSKEVPFERTLKGIAKWKQIIIMMAGIFMNFILAFIIVSLVILNGGYYAKSADTTLASVTENSPAYHAGLQPNDKIVYMAYDELGISSKPKTFDDISTFMYGHESEELTIIVEREGIAKEFNIVPEYNENENRYMIGIGSSQLVPVSVNIYNCWGFAIDYLMYATRSIIMSLVHLFKGVGLENLSGPVGIYQATSDAVDMGISSYLLMMGVISLNVGIFNALPLPIMDGGRVLILIVESIIRRPLSEKIINALMSLSMALILLLFVYVTFQDVLKLIF